MAAALRTQEVSRRSFIGKASAGIAALSPLARSLSAAPLGIPIGCQVYPVREMLGKDFDGTLRKLAAIGYKTIEMCSPQGYARSGFEPLAAMKASEMRRRIRAAGLECESCHYTMRELREHLQERIAFAQELGLKQMILSSFAVGRSAAITEWVRAAGELNRMAEEIHKAGIQAGFHNHDGEFKELDGVLIYDKLMSELNPKLVRMQFQAVVVRLGFEAPAIFEKYPGRFLSLHLQDWSPAEKKMVAIGQGQVDWKKLFGAAKDAGVRNYFVEMNLELMKASYPYLNRLQV
ncbi:MAG: sugar phosphate isomerase/epimerase family protein [Bryobacteraceae bacterium]